MLLVAALLCFAIVNVSGAPAEAPVRVELPVFDEPAGDGASEPAVGEDRSDRTLSVGLLGHKLQTAGSLLGGKLVSYL